MSMMELVVVACSMHGAVLAARTLTILSFFPRSKRTLTPTKKVSKEDFAKTKEDIEDVFALFRDFVAQNRLSLDIDEVATGETWFGTAALERNLCDEINTVDEVLVDYVQKGFDVYEVEYNPPPEETPLGKLLGTPATDDVSTGAIRWLVQQVASAIRSELLDTTSTKSPSVEERYMAQDDVADQIRSQS